MSVRLQQFDASFPYFVVQAIDKAGNVSDVYRFDNPYYLAPDAEDNAENPAIQLPTTAFPSAPSEAIGEVTDHMETDPDGNSIDYQYAYTSDIGRVFYTIQTQTGKVFYLIIDRDGNGERAYFLTEIDENDLLNAPSDISQTLPQNSTATSNNAGMIPDIVVAPDIRESDIPAAQAEATGVDNSAPAETVDVSENTVSEDTVSGNETGGSSNAAGNILIIVGAVIFIIVAYFVKVKKPKGKKQTDEAIEDEEDEIPMDEED